MGLVARGGGEGDERDEHDAADGEGGTRWCLECGGEWVDQLDECPDCGVALVDQNPFTELAPPADGEAHIEYELDAWATESRVMLDQLLQGESLAHAWQGARLVVPEQVEARVDELVEQVERTTLPTLDPDLDRVAFSLEEWTDELVDVLGEQLDRAGIPWELDVEGELVVHAHQADDVEVLLDAVEEEADALPLDDELEGAAAEGDDAGDDAAGDDEAGEDGGDEDVGVDIDPDAVLGGLFVACDRLAKDARDHRGVLEAAEAARAIGEARMPYGFALGTWNDLRRRSAQLLDLLDDGASTDEQVEVAAIELRVLLRTLV